jgi:hypothetical protein
MNIPCFSLIHGFRAMNMNHAKPQSNFFAFGLRLPAALMEIDSGITTQKSGFVKNRFAWLLLLCCSLMFGLSRASAQFSPIPLSGGTPVKMVADFQRPFIYVIQSPASGATNGTIYLNFPANTYEIFAYDVPAWSYALGAQPGVGGVFKVGQTYRQIDLNAAPYDFGAAHKGHSAQFRSDNMSRAVFWNTLIDQMGLTP